MSAITRTRNVFLKIWESMVGVRSLAVNVGLFVLCGLFVAPIFIFFMNSVKKASGIFMRSYELPDQITLSKYVFVWLEKGFSQYMLNSILVVGISLLLVLFCSILAAYAIVRFDFRGKYIITAVILAGFMIPTQILFIPRYVMMSSLDLLNTRLSLILVYVASALPFSIFLLRQFFVDIPESLPEAARLDGCSDLQILYRIYLPLAIPAVSAVFIYQFVIFWNEFLYAFSFITSNSLKTLPAGLLEFKGAYGTNWSLMMAGVGIAVIPTMVMFIVFRNQFLKSINMQAKG